MEGTEIKPEATENNDAAVKAWTKKDAKAMFILSSSIDYMHLNYLVTCTTSREMWTKLSSIHEQKSASNKLALTTKFHEYRMAQTDSIAQHFAKVENIANQLKDIGQEISQVMVMAKMLSTLPTKYNAFISAWDNLQETDQTLDKIREPLLREETRMTTTDDVTNALAATTISSNRSGDHRNHPTNESNQQKKNMICNFCKKFL